ncbi:sugar-binding protein [Stieleria sp. JC731]|uniref:sugar-binding protein n=1 Tax=Pirellulaceae TaxID=2691357 RepID=UPI001E4ABD46|nr:sugar-binding protein [Stieleria sp. JC731]MCC9601331.1 sugar-binding protein [Stieleria sp. JC731]
MSNCLRFFRRHSIAGASSWAGRVSLIALVAAMAVGCKIEKVDSNQENELAETNAANAIKKADGDDIKVAYVTNGIASFWVIAEAGCKAAARDLGVECTIRMPDGAADQKRTLEELISLGVDGVAVSPIDPANQTSILNEVAASTNLITQDSDAPDANRLAYIGMNNYDAGRMCGKLVKEALPDGGDVMIFVGRLGQLNADQRRQGVIDELLDRSNDPKRAFDAADAVLKGDKYRILDTRTDDFDFAKAKSLAEDAIVKYPEIGCMVGLFAYNPPNILEAISGAGKLGEIKVVGFDEDDRTLQAIVSGDCHGTIVQNPYQYGYKSVEMLSKLAAGDETALPEGGFLDIPARSIRQDNVQEFWDELKSLTGDEAGAK